MSNKSTFTAQLRIEAIVADAQKELTAFGNSLRNAWQGGEPPKSLMRTYEQMRVRLESLKQISEKGLVDTSDLRQAENDFKAFQKDIHNLTVEFKLMSTEQKRAMLSTEEQAATKARTAAVKEYTDALKKNQDIAKQRKPLEEQRERLVKEQEPRRKQLQATLTDVEARKARLDSRGPVYNKAAEQYAANADKAKTYATKIKNLELKPVLSKKDTETLEIYKNALKEIDVITGKADWEEATRRHKEEVEKAKNIIEATTQEMEEMDSTVRKLDGQLTKLNPINETEQLNKLKERLKELGVEGIDDAKDIDTLRKAIQQLDDKAFARVEQSLKDMNAGLNTMGAEALQVGKEIDASTEAIERQNEALRNQEAFEGRIKQFLGMTGAVEVLRRAMTNAFNTIKELDAAMTEMAVVTDTDISGYWDQLPEYTARANELGLTIKDVYQADTLFYQQGLKTNEVIELSTQTMRMARVAGLDTAEATDRMTAALRGFNMELNEANAQKIADVYSELAAITASDVDEISSAMTKTASIAASAGMEFETTAAFLSQIIETTRESAETAGTAMKTVIARFQELKKDPSEIGEVDGEIVDANKIETALRSVGVSLRDASGQFRDLDDVFLELSKKWNDLDKNTQRYIATIAAGSRQQSRFIAMMSDYGRTQELVSAAANSAGANSEQFEKTVESLSAKLNELKNAWNEFSMGILESDLVKAGVDILTKLLTVLNKMTSAFGGLGGSIMKVITVIGLFKTAQRLFSKVKEPVINAMSEVVAAAYHKGKEATKEFARGSSDGAKEVQEGAQKKESPSQQPTEKQPAGKRILNYVGDKTGVSNIIGGISELKKNPEEKKAAQEKLAKMDAEGFNLEEKKAYLAKKKAHGWNKDGTDSKANGAEKSRAEYEKTKQEIAEYEEATQKAGKTSEEAWAQVGQGVQQVGTAVTALGIGVSAFGAILSELGLEEAGETITKIGTGITFAGTAITALGPIITAVSSIATAAGMTTAAAWGWVALIVAGVVLLVATVAIIFAQIEKNNPDKKLEKAQKAAEGAAQGAERAAQAFDDLGNSLDSLGDQYDALEGLTRGTEEWNKAMQDVNSSVLDLIDKYPELAGFVENEGGVLTLDVNSEEVKDVLNTYKQDAIYAQGASVGAKAGLSRANAEYDLDNMDDKVFEKFQTTGQGAATWTAIGNLGAATVAGAAGGAGIGAGIGAIAGGIAGSAAYGVGAVPGAAAGAGTGALIGAIVGGVAGLSAGIATFQYTVDQVEKNNEQNRQNVKELAQAYANGETGETVTEIADYIERNGIAMGDAAEDMANALIEEAATMKEYGETLNALDAQEKAYYQAMATNAQQLLDLGAMTDKEINQINAVFDEDLMKDYEAAEKERLKNEAENKNLDKEKEDFAKQVYGENAKVQGNKIVDEKGEVLREFTDDEAWINEMAAANATLKAADAMEEIPGAILQSIKNLEPELQKVFSKALEGKDLTKAELEDFSSGLGTVTYYDKETGEKAKTWNELDENTKNIWGSEAAYLKSLDADYSDIDKKWNNLTDAQKRAYGWNGDSSDAESLNKAKEAYEATFTEILEAQTKAFKEAEAAAEDLGITLASQLSSSAAQAWTLSLQDIALGVDDGEVSAVNDALTQFLSGMTAEQAELVMAEINAMDKMDVNAWNNLGDALEGLNIDYSITALENLKTAGIAAYNAIDKINFDTLAQDINKVYETIKKAKEGSRTYSSDDYQELIAANKSLEESFVQIGDQFVYIGGSMDALVEALEENTFAKLTEASRQLDARTQMSSIISTNAENYGDVAAMGTFDLMTYLTDMRESISVQGLDLADFGIAGLSNTTDFSKATAEQLQSWANAIATGGKEAVYKDAYAKNLEQANIVRFSQNNALYNAEQAASDSKYAAQHQKALLTQAAQSGVVRDDQIKAYQEAIDSGDKALIKSIGEEIASQIESAVEQSTGRSSFIDMTQRVVAALEKQTQKEIDELSTINDSINTANDKMLNKIQEQIDESRAQRAQDQMEKDLASMQSQQAYLAMDTSGANALDIQSLDEEIAQAEQDYQDTLVDQALQSLQDANEQAAEQRERQIMIAEQQLQNAVESGELAQQASEIVAESIESLKDGTAIEATTMGQLLEKTETQGLTELEKQDWATNLLKESTAIANWLGNKDKPRPEITGQVEIVQDANATDESGQRANNALEAAKRSLMSATGGGFITQSKDVNSDFMKAYESYKATTGEALTAEEFAKKAAGDDYRKYDFKTVGEITTKGNNFNWKNAADNKSEDGPIKLSDGTEYRVRIKGSSSAAAAAAQALGVDDNHAFLYSGNGYIYHDGKAYNIIKSKKSGSWEDFTGFKTGGLADFTGPAWLDGTKSRPELVLNQRDTANFIQLKDILAEVMERSSGTSSKTKSTGDNYFEIEINVDSIDNDYDVEQIANKIRSMIYEDAAYRNVNAINNIR